MKAILLTLVRVILLAGVFMALFRPPAIARAHMLELLSSNLLFGILLAFLMLWKPAPRNPAIKESSYAH